MCDPGMFTCLLLDRHVLLISLACMCVFLVWRHNVCVCNVCVWASVQSRAEMSGLARGTHLHLGTSSGWRQQSLALIIPPVLRRRSPSGAMMADVCVSACF